MSIFDGTFRFPNQDKSPVFKFLRGLGQTTKDFGYYFFSPGQARIDVSKIFQGHHIIPTNIFKDFAYEDFFKDIYEKGYRQADDLTNRAWLPSNDADAVRLGSAKHTGSHGSYDNFIRSKLGEIISKTNQDIRNSVLTPDAAWARCLFISSFSPYRYNIRGARI